MSSKSQIDTLMLQFESYKRQTDSRLAFLEDTVRKQKETISVLMNAFDMVNQMGSLATTHPQASAVRETFPQPVNGTERLSAAKGASMEARWPTENRTWTTPASENLETGENYEEDKTSLLNYEKSYQEYEIEVPVQRDPMMSSAENQLNSDLDLLGADQVALNNLFNNDEHKVRRPQNQWKSARNTH